MAYGTPDRTYGGGCDGCRSSRNVATGLGFSLPSFLKPVLSEAASFIPVAGPLVSAGINQIPSSSGGAVAGPCPQPPLNAVAAVLASMTAAELAALQKSLSNSDRPYASATNPADVAYWVAGGKDCNTDPRKHPDVAALQARIVAAAQSMTLAAPGSQYPIQGGPTVSPIIYNGYPTATDYVPIAGPAVQEQQSTIDKILHALEQAGQAGLTAATTSAVGTVYHALPPQQQQTVQGTVLRSTFDQYKVPLLIGAGVLAVVVLTRHH